MSSRYIWIASMGGIGIVFTYFFPLIAVLDAAQIFVYNFLYFLALLIGYIAAVLLIYPLSISGGCMRRCLQWLLSSVILFSASFMFGPPITYYGIVDGSLFMYVQGVIQAISLLSMLVAIYYFATIAAAQLIHIRTLIGATVYAGCLAAALYLIYSMNMFDVDTALLYVLVGVLMYLSSLAMVVVGTSLFFVGSGMKRVVFVWLKASTFLCIGFTVSGVLLVWSALNTDVYLIVYMTSMVLAMTALLIASIQIRRLRVYAKEYSPS